MVGAPEQTLAAYRAALDLGVSTIEADVRPTRDGALVLHHDATLDRTTNGSGLLAERTLRELRELDAGSWFSPRYSGERIPTLDELFELAEERGARLCLEVKGEDPTATSRLAVTVARQIAERGRLEIDVLASFDHDALADARSAVPGLSLAPDRLPERGSSRAEELIKQAQRIGAQIIQHHHEDLEPDTVAEVQAAGVAIWAWSTTTSEGVARLRHFGVAGIMGDDARALAESEPGIRE